MKVAIYWFKRDLRIEDNRGLYYASKIADKIIPIFIIDPYLLSDFKISQDDERVAFLFDILENLNNELEFYVFYDKTDAVFGNLFKNYKIDFLVTSEPLTPSGRARLETVSNICKLNNVKLIEVKDNLLVNENIYSMRPFHLFFNDWINKIESKIKNVEKIKILEINETKFDEIKKKIKIKKSKYWKYEQIYEILDYDFKKYNVNSKSLENSSKVSPYLRMGLISVRKLFNLAKENKSYIRQLCWREYYYQLFKTFPSMKNIELKPWARKIKWNYDDELINAFKEGKTGYPIIDAGIKELKERKWIHNRIRLLLGSFLTKNLAIDWRIGEEFFKEHLIDYDEALNIGNWQWVASVGVDYQNFRYFNPIIQSKKFDSDCRYIKKNIPDLATHECRMLHDPIKYKLNYYSPIVDFQTSIKNTKSIYVKAFNKN
ncbi:MAG: FAD-binding domain-containing protein [Candidatus Micrarchaeia archaeon]